MTLPSLTRSWQFQVNQGVTAQGSVLATARALLRTIKDSMLGTGSWTDSAGTATTSTSNWTVSGSCNSVATGMDGTDRWTASSDLVWAAGAGAKSWIVLRQTGIATKYEILIELSAAGPVANLCSISVSPSAGFGSANGGTDGSTTTPPTAIDGISLITGAAWGMSTSDANQRWHVMKSSTGRSTRVLISRNGWAVALWSFEQPGSVVTGWTNPSASWVIASGTAAPASSALTYATAAGSAIAQGRGASSMAMFLTGEGIRSASAATVLLGERDTSANVISGNYPFYPIGLYSDTASNKGRHGTMVDLWWGLGSLADTTTYPLAGTKNFIHSGAFVIPWNTTTPVFI